MPALSGSCASVLMLLALTGAAQAEVIVTGRSSASGELRNDAIRSVSRYATKGVDCKAIDSIDIQALAIPDGVQFGPGGALLMGSLNERWTVELCQQARTFIVTFTGNGMLGASVSVKAGTP